MPMKNWVALRFRSDGSDDPTGDSEPTFIEVTGEDPLPVTVGGVFVPPSYSSVTATADLLVKTGAGVLHTLSFSPNDAVATAGSIIVYDAPVAGTTGKVLFNWNIAAAAFIPFTILLDSEILDGLYIDFTTTADVNLSVSYK